MRDYSTATTDAAEAHAAAEAHWPTRRELAEDRGYSPDEPDHGAPLPCPAYLAAAIREASRLVEERRAADRAWRREREAS